MNAPRAAPVLPTMTVQRVAAVVLTLLTAATSLAVPAVLTLRPPTVGIAPSRSLGDLGALPGGLPDGAELDQALGPVADDLSQIGIYVEQPPGRSRPAVRLEVLDGATVVRSAVAPQSASTESELWFDFAPIPDSGGRRLTARVIALGGAATVLFSPVVSPFAADAPRMTGDGGPTAVMLPLRTRFGAPRPALEQLPVMVDRASQYRPVWLKGLPIVVLAIIAIVVVAALCSALVLAPGLDDRPDPPRAAGGAGAPDEDR
jgi:hypothetical protein